MKHRTGHLFRRGTNFYVRWTVEGKVFSKALRDDAGNAITTKREGDEAREKLMAPFAVADEASALESIAAKLAGRKAELAEWQDKQNPPLSIAQAWGEFLLSPNRPDTGPATLTKYEYQWNAFSDWMKETHPNLFALREVTKEVAEQYMGTLNHGRLSPNTYNKNLSLLGMVFRVLKSKAKLHDNPWQEIQRKRLVTFSRRELSIEELKKVCENATGELRTLFALGIYSGLRLGDACTLRWGETDLRRGLITRIPNKLARRNPKPVIIPIHAVLREMLAEAPAENRGEYVLPEMAAQYQKRINEVTDQIQAHFEANSIRTHKPGSGKDGKRCIVEVGFHSLRHSFVSLCRESGVPLAVVESLVGHSSPALTRHYTHIGELAASNAVATLPAVMGDSKPDPPKSAPEVILNQIRAIVEKMTGKDWRKKKAALLALLGPAGRAENERSGKKSAKVSDQIVRPRPRS
jgi:integrase